jgi:hypothetical protein
VDPGEVLTRRTDTLSRRRWLSPMSPIWTPPPGQPTQASETQQRAQSGWRMGAPISTDRMHLTAWWDARLTTNGVWKLKPTHRQLPFGSSEPTPHAPTAMSCNTRVREEVREEVRRGEKAAAGRPTETVLTPYRASGDGIRMPRGEGSILLRPGSHLPVVPTFVGYARETHSATRLALRVQ